MVICAKMAEPTEMPFWLWAWMGPRNHALDGGPHALTDIAMATNFWLLMGYSFGCRIASDTLFDSRDGLSGSNYLMKIYPRSYV